MAWIDGSAITRLILACAAIAIVAVLIAAGPSTCNAHKQDQESGSWPSTTGRIISSRMMAGPPDAEWSEVTYEYQVRGQRYTSDRVSFGGPLHVHINAPSEVCCGDTAREVVQRYSAGRRVTVHYDPDNPAEALLQPGDGSQILLEYAGAWLMGLVVALAFLAVAVFGRSHE